MVIHDSLTIFDSKATAEFIAQENQRNDAEWSYIVSEYDGGFIITVYDETFQKLGTL